MIESFKITKLFGFRTVNLTFEDNIKILIGENGLGKTTVLNSLYYTLNQMYNKLGKIDFETIELKFYNYEIVTFSKYELESYLEFKENTKRHRRRFPMRVQHELEEIGTEGLKKAFNNETKLSRKSEKIIETFIEEHNIRPFAPNQIMVREIFNYINEPTFEVFNYFNSLITELNYSILYLPTYRRVEEDLKNLGNYNERTPHYDNEETYYENVKSDRLIDDDTLIHFGMEDVNQRVNTIENQIEKSTISGFSKLTGDMLSQLLKGFPTIQDEVIDELDEVTVQIILHRVGNNLSDNDRQHILNLLADKQSLKAKNDLVYFISRLINIYNEHKHLDDAVKNFRDVCNKYLVDKQFIYDESSVDLTLCRHNTGEIVALNKLSSGEKQIISIFSKIYLEKNDNMIVLFDEPELSLSLPWQEQLLPDIMDSNKCTFLLSVTHSPFIFENDLENYAVGMSTYISEDDE